MTTSGGKRSFVAAALLVLGAVLTQLPAAGGQRAPQQRRQRPPEYVEFQNALRIEDPAARLQELERIVAAYPGSQLRPALDRSILNTRVALASSVDEILKLQQPAIEKARGMDLVSLYFSFSWDILRHARAAEFDKQRVTQAVLDYGEAGLKLARDPEFQKGLEPGELEALNLNWPNLYLTKTAAYLNAGDVQKAATALDLFKKNKGKMGPVYESVQGDLDLRMGREKEALDSYLAAAASDYGDTPAKAKALYQKLHGGLAGYEAALEDKERKPPFEPERFQPAKKWSGKTVLAELFTGSECPPCVASDLAFDGLLEAYAPQYVAVLEYHVPIPRPDPMMNQATRLRLQEYGVSSTPTAFFDGQRKPGGGGPRPMAAEKYNEYATEVNARLAETPAVRLEVRAALHGDIVEVGFKIDRAVPGAAYHLALVQTEEKFRGSNSLLFHKMVVRDFITLTDEALRRAKFEISLPAAEAAAAGRLAEVESTTSFKFAEKKSEIDRSRLRVVFFAQDAATKKVLNAAVADVH
jgi:thiol-disulfide isomerase/thioredoxin